MVLPCATSLSVGTKFFYSYWEDSALSPSVSSPQLWRSKCDSSHSEEQIEKYKTWALFYHFLVIAGSAAWLLCKSVNQKYLKCPGAKLWLSSSFNLTIITPIQTSFCPGVNGYCKLLLQGFDKKSIVKWNVPECSGFAGPECQYSHQLQAITVLSQPAQLTPVDHRCSLLHITFSIKGEGRGEGSHLLEHSMWFSSDPAPFSWTFRTTFLSVAFCTSSGLSVT